jgi:hypothetical protein
MLLDFFKDFSQKQKGWPGLITKQINSEVLGCSTLNELTLQCRLRKLTLPWTNYPKGQ